MAVSRGFKTYLDASSIHGLKYLIQSRTLLERLLWALTILLAFGYLAFLSWTSFKEAAENPMIASIDIMDRSEINYPGVTVLSSRLHKPRNFRFLTNVLNALEFDCTHKDWDCMDRTRKLREDFKPMLKALVSSVHAVFSNPKDGRRRNVIHRFPTKSHLVNNLTTLFCQLEHGLSRNKQNNTREEGKLETFLVDNFRAPSQQFVQMLQKEVLKILDLKNAVNNSRDIRLQNDASKEPCDILNLSLSSVGEWWNTYLLLTDSEPELSFGDLFDFIFLPYLHPELKKHIRLNLALNEGLSLIQNLILGLDLGLQGFNASDVYSTFITGKCPVPLSTLFDETSSKEKDSGHCPAHGNIDTFAKHVDGLYHVFSYVTQPTTLTIQGDRLIQDIEAAVNRTVYAVKPKYEWRNLDPILIDCHFGKFQKMPRKPGDRDKCTMFKRHYYYGGIGYTLNSKSFFDIYSRSPTNQAFHDNFYLQDTNANNPPIDFGAENKLLDFSISFDSGTMAGNGGRAMNAILIHSPFETNGRAISLYSGNRYFITVTPSYVTTDEDAKGVPATKRGCLFQSEMKNLKSSSFSGYQEGQCILECMEKPDLCRIWYFPQKNATSFCPHDKSTSWISSRNVNKVCDCPPGCNLNTYQLEVETRPLHLEGQTNDNDRDCSSVSKLFWRSHILEFLSATNTDWQTSLDNGCRFAKKMTTRVTFYVYTNSVRRVHRRKRISFTDQMAIIGGLLGLFTGMSILSLAEAAMWAGRAITSCLRGSKKVDAKEMQGVFMKARVGA